MKQIIISILFTVLLYSCVKDLEIDSSHQQPKIVVNCLFSSDKSWDIQITQSKNIGDNADRFVENAEVIINAENSDAIVLNYHEKGHYTSQSMPAIGTNYQLEINVPGHPEITAQSCIQDTATAQLEDFKISWAKYMYPNNLMDYDAIPLKIRLSHKVNRFLFFRAHTFNPEYGYLRYKLTTSSLEKLKAGGIPEKGIERLSNFTNEWHIGKDVFYSCLDDLGDVSETVNYMNLISKELLNKKINYREYNAFSRVPCFADSDWLENISYDTYTVLGVAESLEVANILYADLDLKYQMEVGSKRNQEYWLEVTTGSTEYYNYFKTYILQVSQRINPYSEPVVAYSNINNGVGIFAGYNRQMIHFFDY